MYIRNYNLNQVYRRIPLNFFPSSLAISSTDRFIAIGTKEGELLFITRNEQTIDSGFNLEMHRGHYDTIKDLDFIEEERLISSSHSEILVWDINI